MTTLPGIDVSRIGQGDKFPWDTYRGRIAFAFCKATEGLNFQDGAYDENMGGAAALGIVRGAYHVLHPDLPGAQQADYFLAYAQPDAGELVMLDVEISTDAAGNSVPPAKVAACVAAFVDTVRFETGAWPVVYVTQSMAQAGYVASAGQCPAFIADPSHVQLPNPIGPWRLVSFVQTGQVGVDTDVFYGDMVELTRLTTTRRPAPPAPPALAPAPVAAAPALPADLLAVNVSHVYAPGEKLACVWLTSTDGGVTYRPQPAAAAAAAG